MAKKASLDDLQKALDNMAKRSLLARRIGECDYDYKVRVLTKLFEDSIEEIKKIKLINYNKIWNELNKKKAT